MTSGTGTGSGTSGGSAVPPPPPPPKAGWRKRIGTTTQQFKARVGGRWFVIAVIAGAGICLLACSGAIMALFGWMNTPNTREEIAAAAPRVDPPAAETADLDREIPAPAADDELDPEDPGETDVGDEDAEAEAEVAAAAEDDEADAAIVVAAAEPDAAAPEGNFETATGETRTAEGEGGSAVAVPVLPPPPLPAGPAEPLPPAADPVVVATADTTSPCGTPEGLTDEGHLQCLDHVLGLARALTPDWHPGAAP